MEIYVLFASTLWLAATGGNKVRFRIPCTVRFILVSPLDCVNVACEELSVILLSDMLLTLKIFLFIESSLDSK